MRALTALAILLFPVLSGCQELPSLDVLLDRLDAYARQYQATLPSLACDEQITSQALSRRGRVTWQVRVRSTLREVRTEDPFRPFVERRELLSVDGRRPRSTFRTSELPFFAEGGFAGLAGFKRWEERECFDYAVAPGEEAGSVRVEMRLKANRASEACAKLPLGLHRIVVADPGDGRITHTERSIDPDAAVDTEVYFGGIDYAPRRLGERTFWLPSRFYAHDAQDRARMEAVYSNCHRYAGELRILPGTPPPEANQEPR